LSAAQPRVHRLRGIKATVHIRFAFLHPTAVIKVSLTA
jgi:hypothetical protein